ncbi:MAG TPA: GtrA family protein [Jatrophihabitans sp.]|jgi:putative flippase GtrA
MTATESSQSMTERLREYLRNSWRILLKEISAFGVIGIVALAIDLGVFTWLAPHGAVKAKIISTTLSTTFAYIGNRYLSFSHRARTSIARETAFFFGINLITLAFSTACIAVFVYPLHYAHDSVTVFMVNVATIGIGTLFRFWAYKRFVFLHPDRVHQHHIDLNEELAE